MKQKIKNSCFSKMKRVALALFAALCVGSVWAGSLSFEAQNFAVSEDGTITFNAKLGYHGTTTDRYAQLTAVGYNANGDITFEETKLIGETLTELKLEKEGEGDGYVIQPLTIANSGLSAKESYKVKFHFWAVKSDGSLSADYDITRYVLPPIGVTGITAKYGDLKFRVFGNIESGYNISAIKVNYIVGTGTPNLVADATIDAEARTFLCEIPYTPTEYTLTYKITVEYADGTSKVYLDDVNGVDTLVKTRRTVDNIKVIYTWTGEGDGTSWTDELNWTVNSEADTVGYPGTHDGSYYRTMFTISKDVECIDLQGGTYGFPDDGGMFIYANKTVKFKNGTFRFTSGSISRTKSDLSGDGSGLVGSSDGTIIFENVTLRMCKDNSEEYGYLAVTPRANATVVFDGNIDDKKATWNAVGLHYIPKQSYANTKIVIRNGETRMGYPSDNKGKPSLSGSHTVEINNAIFQINTDNNGITHGIANMIIFRDGTQQARLIIHDGADNNGEREIILPTTVDIKVPAKPFSVPYIQAYSFKGTQSSTFKIDVTDYLGSEKVPLIKLNAASTYKPVLKVIVNGAETTARNAELVWEGNTLYYKQDSQNAALIGNTEYATLGAAVEAATSGATITVLNDCTADTACVIANKTLTIDLNGKTVKANDTDAASDGNGVFWVQTGGVLTLEDSSEDKSGTVDGNGGNGYKMDILADGGKVVINAGNYVNENDGTHTQYDLIYAKNGGEIVINGGTFKCDTPRWTLNSHNTKTGTFVVTGGKFYKYNPTDFDTDEAVTTWCDAKYRAELDEDGWYLIKEGYTVTETSVATVTADTEAEALNQVEFSVTTPEGVDAEKYNDYFKLVATETAEGSKTWTVALALKDELKPVIAETTPAITFNDDGTVTVNIENELPGLNYGVRYATTVEAVETTAPVKGFTVTPADGDTAGFFKVVVDFKEIK